jgi:hypothetical protein
MNGYCSRPRKRRFDAVVLWCCAVWGYEGDKLHLKV